MTTFVLVHGVCVGGWSWDLVKPHLEAAGHEVVAVDLPGDDPAAKFSDYANLIVAELEAMSEDVVLVGHSTGGLTVPIVATLRPVQEIVFLCGAVPVPGESVAERGVEWQGIDPLAWQVLHEDGSFSISPDGFRKHVAPDADPAVIEQTIPRLRRQSLVPFLEACPIAELPRVAYRSIMCREDRIVDPDYSRQVARERLRVEATELPGSHSPMASRPRELAQVLLGTAGSQIGSRPK